MSVVRASASEPTPTTDTPRDAGGAAALTVSPSGLVLEARQSAAALLPQLRAGEPLAQVVPWLAPAHDAACGRAEAPGPVCDVVDGRAVDARPVRHGDGSITWWLIDVTVVRSLRDELRLEQARASFLAEASAALLGSLNVLRCIEISADLAASRLADAALVIAPETRGRCQVASAVTGTRTARTVLRRIDTEQLPGLAEALQGFPPVPSRWIDPALAPAWLAPDGFGEIGSVVVTPLPGHGVPAGALVLLRRAGSGPFSEGEETTAREFATRAGLAMSAARMFADQASITDTLMRELLPPTLQHLHGVEFAGGYRPSQDHERVGGDFYDVHPAVEGSGGTLAVLGDVCGKGLEAAVFTGKIRSALQALLPLAEDHPRLLRLLNDALITDAHARFVTMVLASVTRRGADIRLRLTCAGHPPPLIIRADGRVEEAATHGTLIGALPSIESTTFTTALAPGETCLLYTDGITEAQGGPLGRDMFGEDRLRRVAAECAGMPAEAVVERVQMVAAQWAGRNSHDDMAVMAVTAPHTHHLAAVDGRGPGRFTA